MTQQLKALDLEGRFLPPGEVISDRFKLGEKIGEGPFGQVYRAKDTLVEAEVAVKVFDQAVTKSPVDEERFLKATRRARALTQKNVVRLHDSGVHKDHPWVSMQFLEGLNLRKVVRLRRQRQESFGLDELEPLLSQITLALQHVGRDYPHGNLKPENVIFLPEFVKVTDNYVLAAVPDDVFAKRLGEERFIAPELKTPGREPDARCDVYSVGMLIGFMLFGDDYRPGDESEAPGSLAAVDTLCRRATAKDPAQRYSSVEALNEDFTALIDTGSLLTSPAKPVRPPGAEPIPETEETVVATAPKRGRSKSAPVDMATGMEPESVVEEEPSSLQTQPSKEDKAAAPSTGKKKVDQAAQAPSKKEKIDPLDVETSPEISTPAVDEAPTAEFDRDDDPPELQDLLPTEEVEREQHPPSREDNAEKPSRPEAGETSDDTSAEEVSPPPKPAASPEKKPKAPREDDGAPIGIIAGAGVMVALFLGVVVLALVLPSDETDPVDETDDPVAQKAEDEEDEEADEAALAEKKQEEELEREQELEELRNKLRDATAAASEASYDAFGVAQEKASEEEERIEEEEEAQEQAVAGAGAAPGGADPGGGQPAATQCPSGMARLRVAGELVCIDTHQYPGQGQMPRTNVSWFDARSACQSRGKRLCSLQEWRAACGSGYPYGASFNPNACNTADADGFDRSLSEAGSFPQCRSHVGAYDMSGNVHEWVEEQRVAGGAYDSGPDMARCDYSSAMSAGNSRGNVGFRCCADPQ